ncbi:ferric reductase-like transmembrane domain-containing protein [candidate division WWE3 bacterium]|uniref:Ferric reductase-like transmembrane domain-containing protein n=1 Tax=candidate division WWE3 bacterium TaxID=2053526 RepID=A0A955LGK9_UNCKA|nr:ferric reductase-like transmembrane domain-containing protein [candidate division WWE3 bacterium]
MKPLLSSQKIILLKMIYAVIYAGIVLVLIVLDQPQSIDTWTYTLGKALGFLGITSLVVQFVLGSRITWLERGVGLDRMMRWHKVNAKLATLFLVIHPGLVFFGPLLQAGVKLGEIMNFVSVGILLGDAALILIFIILVTSLYSTKIKLSYERWKWVHKLVYGVIILGFLHSFNVGTEILLKNALFYWWVLLGLSALYAVAYRYLWRPYQHKQSQYTVTNIIQETPTVRTFMLSPIQKKLQYMAGQFAFVRIHAQDLSDEEHSFTISSSPKDEHLSFSIKESGDYTSQLGNVKEGDVFQVEGPYGVFSNHDMKGPFLFIAGGIGITPIRSMLRTMAFLENTEKATLLYANRNMEEIAFYDELEKLQQDHDWFKLVHILSGEEKDGFYKGYINADIIKNEMSDLKNVTIFLVGPPPMMDAVTKELLSLGVSKANIHTERFALR